MEHRFKHDHEKRPGRKSNPCVGSCCHEEAPHHHTVDGYIVKIEDLESLPITDDEITLLRVFLRDEIQAILFDEDSGG